MSLEISNAIEMMDDDEFVRWITPVKKGYLSDYHILVKNESDSTPYWDGQIFRGTKLILHVENAGNGGANKYVIVSRSKDRDDFFEACANAYEEQNIVTPADIACLYIEIRDSAQDSSLALLMK